MNSVRPAREYKQHLVTGMVATCVITESNVENLTKAFRIVALKDLFKQIFEKLFQSDLLCFNEQWIQN